MSHCDICYEYYDTKCALCCKQCKKQIHLACLEKMQREECPFCRYNFGQKKPLSNYSNEIIIPDDLARELLELNENTHGLSYNESIGFYSLNVSLDNYDNLSFFQVPPLNIPDLNLLNDNEDTEEDDDELEENREIDYPEEPTSEDDV